jgi:hypothetical protein
LTLLLYQPAEVLNLRISTTLHVCYIGSLLLACSAIK